MTKDEQVKASYAKIMDGYSELISLDVNEAMSASISVFMGVTEAIMINQGEDFSKKLIINSICNGAERVITVDAASDQAKKTKERGGVVS